MVDESELTPFQLFAQFQRAVGLRTTLRPFEKVVKVKLTDTEATALIETFEVRELAREWRLMKHGHRLVTYARSDITRSWGVPVTMTLWDDDYKPQVVAKFGKSVSMSDYLERRQFEAACYRPGTERQPLDNCDRTMEGSSTPAMVRHWS